MSDRFGWPSASTMTRWRSPGSIGRCVPGWAVGTVRRADQPASPADRRVAGADGAGRVARQLQPRSRVGCPRAGAPGVRHVVAQHHPAPARAPDRAAVDLRRRRGGLPRRRVQLRSPAGRSRFPAARRSRCTWRRWDQRRCAVTGELADGTLPYLAGPRTIAEFIEPTIAKAAAERAGRNRGSSRRCPCW